MADIHVLSLSTKDLLIEELVNLQDVDEVICIVKLKNGDLSVADTGASFEFKCASVQLLQSEILDELRVDIED